MGGGDEAAFAELYERHHASLLSFCRHMAGSREDGEDALQQTFLRAHRALAAGHVPDSVRAWLFAIARNRCLTLIAGRRCAAVPVEEVEITFDGLSDEVRTRAELRELLADLGQLPDDQRAALVLSELGDLSHVEIAGAIGCPPGKVKALVFQARTSLIAERDARETPCDDIRAELAIASGGALRRGPLKRHLRRCDPCRAFQVAVGRQRAGLASILPVAPSAGLQAAVLGSAGAGAALSGGAAAGGAGALGGAAGGGIAAGGGGVAGLGLGAAGLAAAGGVAFKGFVAKAAVTAVTAAGVAAGIHHATPAAPALPSLRTASATVTPGPAPVTGASGEAEVPVRGDGSALPPEAAPPQAATSTAATSSGASTAPATTSTRRHRLRRRLRRAIFRGGPGAQAPAPRIVSGEGEAPLVPDDTPPPPPRRPRVRRPAASPTPTPGPAGTATPAPRPRPRPRATPAPPAATATPAPSATPAPRPRPRPRRNPPPPPAATPSPTATPTPEATPEPTATPTPTP